MTRTARSTRNAAANAHAAETGRKVLAALERGRRIAIAKAQARHAHRTAEIVSLANDDIIAVLRLQLGHVLEIHTVNPSDSGGHG